MKKRILAAILVATTLLQLVALSGCKKATDSDDHAQQTMTRGEWIALLGQTLGMSDYHGDTAYYQDVNPDSEIYPYVQSCYEWGVLSGDGQFNANDAATPEFVAYTAALATGTVPDDLLGNDDAIEKFAQEHGLFPDGKKDVSVEAGLAIAESAQRVYMDDHHENVVDITWTDGVVDLSESLSVSADGTQLTMPTAQADSLAVGSVVIVTSEDGLLVAKKVTSLRTEDGQTILQTEEPDLGDVFDEVTLYDSSAPDLSLAKLENGVTIGPVANPLNVATVKDGVYIDDLVKRGVNQTSPVETKGVGFSLGVNFTDGKISGGLGLGDIDAEVKYPTFPVDKVADGSQEEKLGQIFKKSAKSAPEPITYDDLILIDDAGYECKVQAKGEIEGGYEITGSIDIDNLYIETGFEFKKIFGIPTGIKRVVIEANGSFSTNLTLKGKLSGEVAVATLPIFVANVGLVEVKLILYMDISGELQVKAEVESNVKFEYSNGNIKKTKQTDQSISGEAAIEAEVGPKVNVGLTLIGLKIIDIEASFGINFEFEATEKISRTTNIVDTANAKEKTSTWIYSIALESHLRLPIIKLKVGYDPKSLANKLDIKFSWDIVSKENAPVDWKPPLLNCEIAIWTYTETETLEGEDAEQENSRFDLSQYTLILTGEPQQLELEMLEGKKTPKIIWTSEDPSIATVNDSGLVTPVSTGVTVVTASNKDNPDESVKCTIIVQEIGESNWEFLPADMAVSIA